jgi:hypothetical protein
MRALRPAIVCSLLCGLLIGCSSSRTTRPALEYTVGGCAEELETSRTGTTGEVEFTADGEVIRLDQTLTYVCCAELELTVEQEGNTIRIMERNVGEICRCMCDYHVEAEVSGLEPGVYDVEVWGVEYEDLHSPALLHQARVTL